MKHLNPAPASAPPELLAPIPRSSLASDHNSTLLTKTAERSGSVRFLLYGPPAEEISQLPVSIYQSYREVFAAHQGLSRTPTC